MYLASPDKAKRFRCKCGVTELVKGGTCDFLCSKCRPTQSAQYLAHKAVADAIRQGRLIHPSNLSCADCGLAADRYDHRDYSMPLSVDPVCRRCNALRGHAVNDGEVART